MWDTMRSLSRIERFFATVDWMHEATIPDIIIQTWKEPAPVGSHHLLQSRETKNRPHGPVPLAPGASSEGISMPQSGMIRGAVRARDDQR